MTGKGNFTPTLTRFAKKAKLLREWTRTGIFEGNSAVHQDLERRMRYEGRRQMNKRLDQIARDQRKLNNFYKEIGFPTLPKNHVLSKCWDGKLARVRRATEPPTPKKKRAKKSFLKAESDMSQQDDHSSHTTAGRSEETRPPKTTEDKSRPGSDDT